MRVVLCRAVCKKTGWSLSQITTYEQYFPSIISAIFPTEGLVGLIVPDGYWINLKPIISV